MAAPGPVTGSTFGWTRRSSRRVTIFSSSFAAKAANPAAGEDDPGACGCLRVLLDPPIKSADDKVRYAVADGASLIASVAGLTGEPLKR